MPTWLWERWKNYWTEMWTMIRRVLASFTVFIARKCLRFSLTARKLISHNCSKDFIDTNAFKAHIKSKPHKRRLHALKTEPYSLQEAERAAGLGSYIKPTKRKMETLLPAAVLNQETLEDVKKRAKLEPSDNCLDGEGDVSM